jgi:hypothetical protein
VPGVLKGGDCVNGGRRMNALEKVVALMERKGIATRRNGKRLNILGWTGCAAYIRFNDPDAPISVLELKVIPFHGQRNWRHCENVEAEIMERIEGPDVPT